MHQGKALMESAAYLDEMSADTENRAYWGFLPSRNAGGKGQLLSRGELALHPGVWLEDDSASKDPVVDLVRNVLYTLETYFSNQMIDFRLLEKSGSTRCLRQCN